MARHRFGGGIADWTFTVDGNNVQLVGAALVTFWNLRIGGSQYTDLLDEDGAPISQLVSSDGSDGMGVGQIPPFRGPDNVWAMWAEANGGPRVLMQANDIGDALQELMTEPD